jgi:resuscitation-promoting factor RpfA
MARYRGRHRAPSTTGRNLARTAIAGAVIGAPLAAAPVASAADTVGGTAWDRLAQCESTGNWSINTGNGFSGGLQFTPSTWRAFGGEGVAHHASREEQIVVAERVLAKQGWGAWPACSRKLGLRGTPEPIAKKAKKAPEATQSIAEKVTSTTARKATPTGGSTVAVKQGDTLAKIAAANGVGNWKQLHALNPDLDNPNILKVGQIISLAR